MTSWTTSLLAGFAELLAAGDAGIWRPAGVYSAGETAIVVEAMPPEPERVICLALYPVTDHVEQADVTVGLQVRTRAGRDPRDVAELDDAVYDLLHGVNQTTVGGIRVVQCYRQSSALLGRDQTDRWERTSNYYVDAMRPTAHRPF